jgi:hypothetical protein
MKKGLDGRLEALERIPDPKHYKPVKQPLDLTPEEGEMWRARIAAELEAPGITPIFIVYEDSSPEEAGLDSESQKNWKAARDAAADDERGDE